ncbi:AGAP005820-PA-like protein [Anopheles sinensis]|uniref:AGAP005820-PA-like protein n=1 Tax=Anopheles sinensis TaxID=74873 RepID=A0A084WDD9_ANOSI|nr:AGAP005820-PA-like protein [Anopheles sinensis]
MSIAVRWAKRRVLVASIGAIVLYYFLSSSYQKYQISTVIPRTKPEDVWEFVADFSQMRKLNPTILNFNILADHGNFEHWKYTVTYDERLSHWPYLVNTAIGHFSVRKLPEAEGGQYSVASTHKTCFLLGLFCLNSKGEFKMSRIHQNDTVCEETVFFQCPFFFGRLCRREVEFQRQAIMRNLESHFRQKLHG